MAPLNLCFSIAYSLMSYVVVLRLEYYVAGWRHLLPLVLLGIHWVQEKGSMLLLSRHIRRCLFLSFISPIWWGVFSLLYFIAPCVVKKSFSWKTIGKFAGCVTAGGGPQRLLWLPTYLQLSYVYLTGAPRASLRGDVTFSKIFSKPCSAAMIPSPMACRTFTAGC